MRNTLPLVLVLVLALSYVSCKNDVEKETTQVEEATTIPQEKIQKTPPSEESKKQSQSVLAKLMVTPELKTYTSYLVTAQLTDKLMMEEGPFTIFAPTNTAFNELANGSELLKNDQRELLVTVLENHIVAGEFDSVTLVQNIKDGGGSYKLKTISGVQLTVSKAGNDIIITTSDNKKATLGKSDIKGSNGVVHVLDAVFGVN